VSQWAGNSEASCRLHYLRILTKEDGEKWFEAAIHWEKMERFRAKMRNSVRGVYSRSQRAAFAAGTHSSFTRKDTNKQ